jgi:hypothetical protein
MFLCQPSVGQNKDSIKAKRVVTQVVKDSGENRSVLSKLLPSSLKISGYVDAYYALYTDSVGFGKYQKFPAISPRSNSFGLNIAQLTEQYTTDRIRSTATLQFGDLPSASWSPVYNYIQEANVGVRICKKFWIDGGFFKTHIGTEALLPKDNITSSAAVITYYEPWWQSGLKFTYDASDKLQFALFLENGYNEFVAVNNKKALGLVVNYALGDKGSLGYYNFVGDMAPDNAPVSHIRFLNNLVFTYRFCEKFKMILGMDFISQQHSSITDSTKNAYVYSSILTLNYKFSSKWGIYYRLETFNDPNGFLTGTIINTEGKETGYTLVGITLGFEFKPTENSYIRLEGRDLQMNDTQPIFYTNGMATSGRGEAMLNMGIWF